MVAGSQQAIYLSGQVLLDEGDRVWMEEPGYRGARDALMAAGARLVAVPVDEEGLQVEEGVRLAPGARMAYVTPSHQYPSGRTMTLERRLELLEWAAARKAWVVEDDYDSEFRYASRPLAALQGLDSGSHVIYVGTFSKVLFPALRMGYLVAPEALVDAFGAARALQDRHAPMVEQRVLTAFLEEGHFGRHIRRMRALYWERQEVLLAAVARELGGALTIPAAGAGLHVAGWLSAGVDDEAVSRRALEGGVEAPAISGYCLEPNRRPGLVLGYAGYSAGALRAGVKRLARAFG
jgi:GntR family transcriptional regulator/MocR family aminotransferase